MAITYSQHSNLTDADIHALTRWTVADTAGRLALTPVSTDQDKLCKQLDNGSYWALSDWTGPTWVEFTSAGTAAVTSVFGQIGDVDETDANFTASQIANVPAGSIVATDVQAALNELATEKAPATHTHVLSQITNAGTAAAENVGTAIGDIPQLEDIGGGTPGLPAIDGSQLTGVAGGGSAITVTDEGGAPLTTDAQSFDFVGSGVTASAVGDDVTITIAAGAAPIDTVFGRTGTVVATAGDYTASEVTNVPAGTVAATTVQAAINELDTDKAATTDTRFPTANEKGALAGTGSPSGSNRYVTDDDARLTDAALGPATATDNALARFDTTTGKLLQDSTVTLGDGPTGTMAWAGGSTSINASAIESGTVQAQDALRTWKSHVQYSVPAPVVADVVSRGIWWVKNDSPVTPHFRTGTGVDHNLLTPEGTNVKSTGESANLVLKSNGANGASWQAEAGGGSLAIEDEGVAVPNGPHNTMNFIGSGVTAADAGGGQVNVTIAAGAAPIDTVFGRTGTVSAAASDYQASLVDNDAADTFGNVSGAFVDDALNTADAAIEANTTAAAAAQAAANAAQSDATSAKTKTDRITVTQAVNLDTMESDTATNNAKRSYPSADEAMVDDHEATLANVATPITTVGAALLDDTTVIAQRTTLGLGSAAVENVGTTIGDVAQYVNVGGNAALPAVDGSQLTNLPTGVSTFVALTDVTEPDYIGHAGQFVKVNAGATGLEFDTVPGGGDLLSTNNLSDVANAITATQNLGVEVGVDVAAQGHTHDTLANIASGVILGRDSVGSGLSEELTPAEARALIAVTIDNIGAGVHSSLQDAVPDAGKIFASLQTGQVETLTDVAAATGQKIPIELAGASGAWRRVDMDDLLPNTANVTAAGALMDSEVDANIKTLILPADTTISSFGKSFVAVADASAARTAIGVDASGTARPADEIETSGTNVTISSTAPTGAGQSLVTTSATAAAWKPVPRLTKSIAVETPTASENISMFYTNVAITVTQITSVIVGSTSVTFDIQHGTSRATATGTGVIGTDVECNSTTTGVVTTLFTDATIPADSFVWLTTSDLSGTPTEFHVTVEYTED